MNTKSVSFLALGAAALLGAASSIAADTVPAPASSAAAPVATAAAAEPEIVAPAVQPDRTIYSGQLPSVAQLTQTAQAQGLTIANISQTARDITVTYRLSNHSTRTISYQLLPEAVAAPAPASVPAVVQTAPTTVQVVEYTPAPPTVIYRTYDPYYYDPFYWPRVPVSVNLGFGWGFRGGHGHFHGGRRW